MKTSRACRFADKMVSFFKHVPTQFTVLTACVSRSMLRSRIDLGLILLVCECLQALPGQQTPEGVPSFKLVLVGDGGTGATFKAAKAELSRACWRRVCGLHDDQGASSLCSDDAIVMQERQLSSRGT